MKRQNSFSKTSNSDRVVSTNSNVGDSGSKRQRQETSSGSDNATQEQIEAFQQDAEEIKELLHGQQQAGGSEDMYQHDVHLEQQGMEQDRSEVLSPGSRGDAPLEPAQQRQADPIIDEVVVGALNNIVPNGQDDGHDRPHAILQDGGRDLPQSQANGIVPAYNNHNLREMGNDHGQSSDDGDADDNNIWLAARQRRQPRVGNDFQATLPSPT